MKRTLGTLAVVGALGALSTPASALDYVDNPQLSEALNPQVKACRPFDTLPVPMRVSGGDITALYANGESTTTTSNSLMSKHGVDVELYKQTDFTQQLRDYMSCQSPIMRATQGQINMAAELTESQDKTKMVALYQTGWSNGSAALVTGPDISTPADLSGKTIALQAYGPHVSYMARILRDAQTTVENNGGTWQEPTLVWTENLSGFSGSTPGNAMLSDPDVDAAFVIKADAMILTSGGNVGTGAEGSVRGAEVMMTTRDANRVISNVYVVRKDYFESNREQLKNFVTAMYEADEKAREDIKKMILDFSVPAEHLLDDASAVEDAKQLWRETESVGWKGNNTWMENNQHPKSFLNINNDVQSQFLDFGLMSSTYTVETAEWNFADFKDVLFDTRRGESKLPSFDNEAASKAVSDSAAKGNLDKDTLFTFEIYFKPNQQTFSVAQYEQQFNKVIELASTYGGAVLTVEGHSDPMGYLNKKYKQNYTAAELRRVKQSAKNLSVSRAIQVRDAIMDLATQRSVTMDESQFVTKGMGITQPATGIKGQDSCTADPNKIQGIQTGDPCPPMTKQQWQENRRVVFRMVQLNAESEAFTPTNTWN
jgi:outer membrane protein OmpA-like peptidoglycan-associated protein